MFQNPKDGGEYYCASKLCCDEDMETVRDCHCDFYGYDAGTAEARDDNNASTVEVLGGLVSLSSDLSMFARLTDFRWRMLRAICRRTLEMIKVFSCAF